MIRAERSHIHSAALTHSGMVGKQNEDRYAISAHRIGEVDATPALLAVIADGIGGHRSGEVAAEMAVNTISHVVAQSNAVYPLDTLQQAIQAASQEIAIRAKDDTQRLGMGTTCCCIWVLGDQLYTASVGDSRIYLLRGGAMSRLTTDHTWVQEAIEKGLLDAASARNHPNVHVIRRYLGSSKPPQADVRLRLNTRESDTQARENQGMRLLPGDLLLACTDGLTDELSDGEIFHLLAGVSRGVQSSQELEPAANTLVEAACRHGGRDNITVILLSIPEGIQQWHKVRSNWLSRLIGG